MGAIDAPVQCASSYVGKIKLAIYARSGAVVSDFRAKVPSLIIRHQPIKFNYFQV